MLEAWGSFTGAFVGEIEFNWHPDPAIVAAELRTVAGALEDMAAPLAASRQIAQADIAERFQTKTTPEGTPWEPWSPSYTGNELGVLTGETEAAATSSSAFEVTPREVFYNEGGIPFQGMIFHYGATRGEGMTPTEKADYAERLLAGGFHPRQVKAELKGGGNIQPPRPFIGTSEKAQLAIVDVFDRWFADVVSFAVHPTTGLVQIREPGGRFGPRVGL